MPLAVTLAFAACGVSEPETTRSDVQRLTPQIPAAQLAAAVHDDTEFALDLYKRVGADKANLIFSPHSVTSAVAMLWAGARNGSDTSIAHALHFNSAQADLHPVFNFLDQELAARNDTVDDSDAFTLRVVNDLWAQRGFEILPGYLDTLAAHYGAGVRRVDFAGDTEGARQLINDWVAAQTEDRIEDLFPKGAMNGATVLALTNAIYFKADWAAAFDPSDTAPAAFHLIDDSVAQVDFMNRSGPYRIAEGDGLVAVELPYKGDEVSMLVIMPSDLAAFEATVSADVIEGVVSDLHDGGSVALSIPKWTHKSELSLSSTLGDMGMADVFGSEADLSGIDGARDLFVQAIVHKAFIDVAEDGTEAAAATGITIGITSAPPPPVSVMIDRPFMYLLRDRKTGAVLFLGRVRDPRP